MRFASCVSEYLNFRGGKFSKSRGAAVDVPYYLSKYDPDPLRLYLTATAPETRDTEPVLRAPKDHAGRISSSGTTLSRVLRGERAGGDTFATLSAGLGEE
jgi:hypothetical protein